MKKIGTAIFIFVFAIGFSHATPKLMDEEYAQQFCELWNKTPKLVDGLGKWASKAIKEKREYRIIRFYRKKCGADKAVELHIAPKDGKAICIYGGKATDEKADFIMSATDEDWKSLAKGEFGFAGMGILSKLDFIGSKWEAMNNMGPFKAFLLNIDKIPHTMECP
ncbi:SCP2 sterol-binding domain-containing protein [Persephonella sp. IF05-L8]|uniref:SCP2 sterol-binding domain-containing protein n=1 Tax=Persephonella sp. IF05-L8 TaxID=1158338 RepID=UPI000497EA76